MQQAYSHAAITKHVSSEADDKLFPLPQDTHTFSPLSSADSSMKCVKTALILVPVSDSTWALNCASPVALKTGTAVPLRVVPGERLLVLGFENGNIVAIRIGDEVAAAGASRRQCWGAAGRQSFPRLEPALILHPPGNVLPSMILKQES